MEWNACNGAGGASMYLTRRGTLVRALLTGGVAPGGTVDWQAGAGIGGSRARLDRAQQQRLRAAGAGAASDVAVGNAVRSSGGVLALVEEEQGGAGS